MNTYQKDRVKMQKHLAVKLEALNIMHYLMINDIVKNQYNAKVNYLQILTLQKEIRKLTLKMFKWLID